MNNKLLERNHPIWEKMQGNIAKHHGRKNAYHIFLQFDTNKVMEIKQWIANLNITTAKEQWNDSSRFNALKKQAPLSNSEADELTLLQNKLVSFFFLSKTGYNKLDSNSNWLTDSGFTNGMQKAELNDPKKKDWEFANRPNDSIDALLLIAATDISSLEKEKKDLENNLVQGLTVLHVQKGTVLHNEHQLGIEHFGYVDGISQPLFLEDDEKGPSKNWDDVADIKEMALVQDENVADLDAFGSYFVFRKLEQNVKAFKKAEEDLNLGEIGGAYVVGRFEDGTPVTKYAKEKEIKKEEDLENDFNYKNDDGKRCPFHAHIRITNPRNLQPEKNPIRIVRRGIPYDEVQRDENLSWYPENGVGLLFMCYQKSIVGQFEVLQKNWANNGTIFDKKVAIDGVIGQGNGNKRLQHYPLVWGEERTQTNCNLSGFVTMKGGEYFFAPSIPFLKSLK
jgi:Dyp-type peroxidase family